MMSDFSKRVNSIIVKNLPIDFNANQLQELFSQFGRIVSSKVLPSNPNFEGGCGFVNYADAECCDQAVEHMNNFVVKGSRLTVHHAPSRTGTSDRLQNGFRANDESNARTALSAGVNLDEKNGTSSSSSPRFSSFRPASERSTKSMPMNSSSEVDINKPLWNSNPRQEKSNSKSPIPTVMDIEDHEAFIKDKTYNIYLSNLEVPNIVFAASLDDYVNATLLITQMNKHEELAKVQANSYKTKLVVGQVCAALFNGDWYRARVLEIGENRVRVQYIDWGNKGWCDSTLEIRPLPNEYFKDPALCVKCILDGIPSNEKLSDEQTKAILNILVLDLKLEMTVLRIENGIPHIRLNLDERNLNNEIREHLPSLTTTKSNPVIDFNSHKPEINHSEIHFVQLTTVDPQPECFHVLLMRDHLVTIMNVLKDWNATKQPFTIPPKANMLVCAQYEADDLWYRAWIEKITDKGYHVYFVDFGNEEIVSIDRLSECPENLRVIPWQSVQIKLANIKLTDDERYVLLKDFETDRLEMKIIQKNQEVYLVDLLTNGKSIVEHIVELRKKQPAIKPIEPPVAKPPPTTLLVQPTATPSTLNTVPKPLPAVEQKNDSVINDNLITLITEQRRQNRLLEQVIAAINTTNALLTQLVQR